jgi:hypothetical protein
MLVVVAVLSLLGRWQWDVSQSSHGGLQNFLYAFQWWFMAAMVIYGWWRLLRDDAHPHTRPKPDLVPAPAGEWLGDPRAAFGDAGGTGQAGDPSSAGDLAAATDATTFAADDDDEELAAYNEYLARLNDRARRTG